MKTSRFIDPIKEFGGELYSVEKPARYLGGEVGSRPAISPEDRRLRFALCFPDLYEIGMSNNAIRILYNDMGKLADLLVCERVFAPAPDFEALLRRRGAPLATLESGIPLCDCDFIGFSIGYELLATNILTVLDAGQVPLLASERREGDPIVIAGGPASTNPHPFGAFMDAVYIGEAEAGFYTLMAELAGMKRDGACRADLLARLGEEKAVWLPAKTPGGRTKPAFRAVFSEFPESEASTGFPVPVLQTVQSHGTVEIMRGCPNGCRFCHAGFYYRPQRLKSIEIIEREVKALVEKGGYREITLSSLSSGDYPDIVGLFRRLNAAWGGRSVSFQLPSLKVDSFTLPLLAELSEVRKSGITFAVETPIESWQGAINKAVSFDKIASILKEAKRYGFRSAKFYFMIGLPVPGKGRGEGEAIVDFLKKVASVERMALNVNVGTFVPKPHTPYAREAQLGEEEAIATIRLIKDALRPYKFISLSYHSPYVSMLEGVLSRGDDAVSGLILSAWRKGARLDAWEEHFDRKLWDSVFEEAKATLGADPRAIYLAGVSNDAKLPWDDVNLFVSRVYYEREREKSLAGEMTRPCAEDCDHPCGSCNDSFHIVSNSIQQEVSPESYSELANEPPVPEVFSLGDASASTLDDLRFVASFRKESAASFYPLHAISGIFERAFQMMGLPVRFTEGFNPLPRMELTQPLALGIESAEDIMAVWLETKIDIPDVEAFIERFNRCVPKGIRLNEVRLGKRRSEGKNSIGSCYWGSEYEVSVKNTADFEIIHNYLQATLSEPEGFTEDSANHAFDIIVNDAHGGDRNIMKMIARALEEEKALDRCSVRRKAALGVPQSSTSRNRLFDLL